MIARPPTLPLSRRRLLAISGATAAAGSSAFLAACGAVAEDEEEATPEEQSAALNAVLAQQLAVFDAAAAVSGSAPPEEAEGASTALRNLRDRSIKELRAAIGELGGSATQEPAPQAAQAESPVEGLARQLDASLAACTRAIGDLAADRRQPVQRAIAEDAATLAVMRSVLGEDVATDAFVLGAGQGAGS